MAQGMMVCAAGVVGVAGKGTVENCHFDGVVGADSISAPLCSATELGGI